MPVQGFNSLQHILVYGAESQLLKQMYGSALKNWVCRIQPTDIRTIKTNTSLRAPSHTRLML